MRGSLNYDKCACAIQWISEEFKIDELEPFLQFIRADNGEDWIHITCGRDFKIISLSNFEILPGEDKDIFYIHYNAEIEIDLDSVSDFKKALDFSSNEVIGQIGFKKSGEVIEGSELFDGWDDEVTLLI